MSFIKPNKCNYWNQMLINNILQYMCQLQWGTRNQQPNSNQNYSETRSTQRAQTSMVEADHYSRITYCIMCMKGCEAAKRQQCYYALHCLGGEPQSVLIITCTTIWSCYSYYVFCSFTHLRRPISPPNFNQF